MSPATFLSQDEMCRADTDLIFPLLKKSDSSVILTNRSLCMCFSSFQIFSLQEETEAGPDVKKKGQKKAKKSNKSKANQRKNSKKSNTPQTGNDLSAKIFATMEKHKEVFFVIRLHSAQSAASLAVSIDFENSLSE